MSVSKNTDFSFEVSEYPLNLTDLENAVKEKIISNLDFQSLTKWMFASTASSVSATMATTVAPATFGLEHLQIAVASKIIEKSSALNLALWQIRRMKMQKMQKSMEDIESDDHHDHHGYHFHDDQKFHNSKGKCRYSRSDRSGIYKYKLNLTHV